MPLQETHPSLFQGGSGEIILQMIWERVGKIFCIFYKNILLCKIKFLDHPPEEMKTKIKIITLPSSDKGDRGVHCVS